ncbi:MAG: uracil-DNA glycosylase family protein [Spirochaetaceae bacterium]|nr:uracil-DNA glycosylase family protein [Spirochaetaceae bacterium]
MDKKNWAALVPVITRYKCFVAELAADLPALAECIQRLVDERSGPSYTVKNSVVYNGALEDLNARDNIHMILVGDNPGRREQEQGRYLIGPSGKIAETFFRTHPELDTDFRKHVLILNKTPIHTPRTAELKELCRLGGGRIAGAVRSSQRAMAELLYESWKALAGAGERKTASPETPGRSPKIWITGYSEMKRGGIFEAYTERLKELCAADRGFKESVWLFRHFSMNQFIIDLNKKALAKENLLQSLERIGLEYHARVLGF